MTPIVVYPSKSKTLMLVAIGAGFVALGLLFAVFREEMEIPLWILIITSYIGVPMFGLATLYGLYRVVVPSPALIIDSEGITDHASGVGVGLVRWQEIDRLVVHEIMGQRMLGIVPLDEGTILRRQNPLKRSLLKMNRGLGPALANIPESMLPARADELLEQILPWLTRAQLRMER